MAIGILLCGEFEPDDDCDCDYCDDDCDCGCESVDNCKDEIPF